MGGGAPPPSPAALDDVAEILYTGGTTRYPKGVPNPKVGERITAFVVLKKDIKCVTGYDLIHWRKERLIDYKILQYVEFRDILPKSKLGKLLRRDIRSEEMSRLEQKPGNK